MPVIELRTYRLRAGSSASFAETMSAKSCPLLQRYGIAVLWHGASVDNEPGVEEYGLIRSFDSVADRAAKEERFYGSAEWHGGLRDEVMAGIESFHTVVLEVPEAVLGRWAGLS